MAKNTSTEFRHDQALFLDRANRSIAQGALTNSKRPESFVKGVYPSHLDKYIGATTYYKNHSWTDYICGLGTNLFGAANPYINRAVIRSIEAGVSFSLSSTLEVEAAERAQSIWPELERVKFFKNGSDATNAAIRIARAYTGRDNILTAGYHGSSDDFVSLTAPAVGIPARHWVWPSCAESIDKMGSKSFAAVIVEPMDLDDSDANREQLQKLREWCDATGTVLIFDEIITGLRVPKLSVSNYYGIKPDLACYGKAIGNGYSISILGGRTDLMTTKDYFVSNTFSGERVGLAAFIAATDLVLIPALNYGRGIDALWSHAGFFWKDINAITDGFVKFKGYPTRGRLEGTALNKALFMQECCKGGLLFGPSYFYNYVHHHHDQSTISVIKSVIQKMKMGLVSLEGEIPKSPMANQMRGEEK